MPDTELKHILKQLGETISETLADSPKISQHLQQIRDAGYELILVIEAKIAFDPGESQKTAPSIDDTGEPVKLKITPEDAKFLKSLKISAD
jgi:hypothetical protein